MCCKGFAKRDLPFFLTFSVGLFIASFFVSIVAPNFRLPSRNSRKVHREVDRQRDIELQQLREENFRLKNPQVLDSENVDYQSLKYSVPRQGK